MKLRPGLQTQFLVVVAAGLLVVVALIGLQLHRQHRTQVEVEDISREAGVSLPAPTPSMP